MERLKLYNEYLNEDYNQKPLQKVQQLMNVLKKSIKDWFTNGSLSKQGLNFHGLDGSFTNDVADKTMILTFDDTNFYYQCVIIIGIKDLFPEDETQLQSQPQPQPQMQENFIQEEEKQIENLDIQIKKYNLDGDNSSSLDGPLVDRWDGTVGVREFNEDFIIEKISQMEDKSLADENTALGSEETQDDTQIQELF